MNISGKMLIKNRAGEITGKTLMSETSHNRIIQRFVAVVVLVLFVLAVLFCMDSVNEYRQHVSSAESRTASAARVFKEHAESMFNEVDNALLNIIEHIGAYQNISKPSTEFLHKELALYSRNSRQISGLILLNSAGNLIAYSGSAALDKNTVFKGSDFFTHHQAFPNYNSPYISISSKLLPTGKWQFTISRPVKNAAGVFDGVIAASIDIDHFVKFHSSMNLDNNSRILLVRTDGHLLLAAPFQESIYQKDFRSSKLIREHLPHNSHGTYRIAAGNTILGESGDRIISYVTLSGYPIVALANLDQDLELGDWHEEFIRHLVIAALLALFCVVMSLLFLRQLKKAGDASRKLESQQQELELKAEMIDSVSDAILLLDEKGGLVQFSNALCSITGLSRQDLMHHRIQDIMPVEKAGLVEGRIQRILKEGEAVFETDYLHVSGRHVPVEGRARSLEIGERRFILSVLRDITDRKDNEQKLKKIASEWRDTFDAVEDAVWLLDMDRRIIRANKANFRIFGTSPEQVTGLSCCEAAHSQFAPHQICPFDRMLETRKRASMLISFSNRWFDMSVDPVFSIEGEIINAVHILKDITVLKRSELRERVRAEILEKIAGDDPLPQILSFIALAIEKVCPEALCSIMLADDDGKRLITGAAPSLPDIYNSAVNRTKIGEGFGSCGTAAFRRERVVVEDINTHPFWKGFVPAQEAGLRSCWSDPVCSSAGQLLGTFAIYHRKPGAPSEEEVLLIQQAAAFTGIAIERNRAGIEREVLEQQLNQSQKMEAIGHLAGGVAHDFNNLLTPIMIYAEMLKRALQDDEKLLVKVDGIIKASGKAKDLSQQLLSFGRKQVMQFQVVNLNDVVSAFMSIIRRTLRESIDINLQLSSQPAIVLADSSKLEQVLLNLAINAQDAIADNGRINIETGQVLIDDEYAKLHPGMHTGKFILFSFSDNGCGMNDETMRHIFEPFYTTKQVGHGTGLGLANVYGIVKQHNGYIAVQSKLGNGTTFNIYLPFSADAPGTALSVSQSAQLDQGGGEVILLVEDNEMVREMTADLLLGLGYRVYVEGHPEQALELAARIPEKIDLLITDVVMPGMNGRQLFERLNVERPDIDKVLYMSGYTNNVFVENGELEDGIQLLQKPFTVDSLIEKVNALLYPPG